MLKEQKMIKQNIKFIEDNFFGDISFQTFLKLNYSKYICNKFLYPNEIKRIKNKICVDTFLYIEKLFDVSKKSDPIEQLEAINKWYLSILSRQFKSLKNKYKYQISNFFHEFRNSFLKFFIINFGKYEVVYNNRNESLNFYFKSYLSLVEHQTMELFEANKEIDKKDFLSSIRSHALDNAEFKKTR